jgi:cholesterol transport system auxiliary component
VLGSIKLSSKKEVTNTNGAAGTVEAFNAATAEVIKSLSLWINEVRK